MNIQNNEIEPTRIDLIRIILSVVLAMIIVIVIILDCINYSNLVKHMSGSALDHATFVFNLLFKIIIGFAAFFFIRG